MVVGVIEMGNQVVEHWLAEMVVVVAIESRRVVVVAEMAVVVEPSFVVSVHCMEPALVVENRLVW
jgi:hypothetical protein